LDDEFGRFVAARGRALCRTAYLLTGDWQIGEDLVQEALTKTYLRRHRLRDQAALEPYARKVLVSVFLSWRRRHWHREMPYANVPDCAADSELDCLLDRSGLWSVLAELPAQQRAVLVLRYFEDLSEADIAAVLGCALGTVKSHASRGLERLRKIAVPAEEEWAR
jgi:RNA polymerase sigma-70 factor (sigma-E family)